MSNKKNEDLEMSGMDEKEFGKRGSFLLKPAPFHRARVDSDMGSILSQLENNPGAAVLAYCFSSISITVVNKYVVSGSSWNLNFPFSQIISFNYGIDLRRDCYCCKRGWTLQEDIFSPRTIHYGSDQIHWECRTAESSESHGVWHTGVPRQLKRDVEFELMEWEKYSKPVTPIWPNIINRYTQRSLTFDRDIFSSPGSNCSMLWRTNRLYI
jgi:hypothetical protein